MAGAHDSERRQPWQAAMRLDVATWKSGFFWQRTDDEHSTCARKRLACSTEVLFCGHYGLEQCTDETSAHTTLSQVPTMQRDKRSRFASPAFVQLWLIERVSQSS